MNKKYRLNKRINNPIYSLHFGFSNNISKFSEISNCSEGKELKDISMGDIKMFGKELARANLLDNKDKKQLARFMISYLEELNN